MSLNLGFFASAMLFLAVIAVPLVGWAVFSLNPVVGFWFAYVVTRPLGASFADWMGKPHATGGGLGWGDGVVAGVATVIIVALVGYVARTRSDVQAPTERQAARRLSTSTVTTASADVTSR